MAANCYPSKRRGFHESEPPALPEAWFCEPLKGAGTSDPFPGGTSKSNGPRINTDRASSCFHTMRVSAPRCNVITRAPWESAPLRSPLPLPLPARFPTGLGRSRWPQAAHDVETRARLHNLRSVCVRVHPWAIVCLPETSNCESPPAKLGVYPEEITQTQIPAKFVTIRGIRGVLGFARLTKCAQLLMTQRTALPYRHAGWSEKTF